MAKAGDRISFKLDLIKVLEIAGESGLTVQVLDDPQYPYPYTQQLVNARLTP